MTMFVSSRNFIGQSVLEPYPVSERRRVLGSTTEVRTWRTLPLIRMTHSSPEITSMKRIVFLGGIPGSGKTTLARGIATRTGAVHVTAGDLIRAARRDAESSGRIRVHGAADAGDNQQLLVDGFRRLVATSDASFLLDGHFVVPSENGPIPVRPEIFVALGVHALAVLLVDPQVSRARLRERGEQARWWDGSADSLRILQDLELEAARGAAVALGVNVHELSDLAELALERLLSEA
jgi:adenylate kinase